MRTTIEKRFRRGLLRPPAWASKPVLWLDQPHYYKWCLEELHAAPFDRKPLGYIETEWIGIACGLSEPYIVNSRAEIVYMPGMPRDLNLDAHTL